MIKTIKYKEYNFNDLSRAMKKQKNMKKLYGYQPSIFKEMKNNKTKYVIVKPSHLRRIDKL